MDDERTRVEVINAAEELLLKARAVARRIQERVARVLDRPPQPEEVRVGDGLTSPDERPNGLRAGEEVVLTGPRYRDARIDRLDLNR